MRIGHAARQAGVGVETIRFYERKGLIRQPGKPAAGGYRCYRADTVETLRFIRQAQDLGFSLKEIADLLDLRANPDSECQDVRARASRKLAEVEHRIARLQNIGDALRQVIATCPSKGRLDGCTIMATLDGGSDREEHGRPQ